MIFIYITCNDIKEAKKIGRLIVEKKLGGCVNIWPVESIYFWEGEIREDQEVAFLVKTLESKLQEIESLIQKNHSYSVPCVAALDIKPIFH